MSLKEFLRAASVSDLAPTSKVIDMDFIELEIMGLTTVFWDIIDRRFRDYVFVAGKAYEQATGLDLLTYNNTTWLIRDTHVLPASAVIEVDTLDPHPMQVEAQKHAESMLDVALKENKRYYDAVNRLAALLKEQAAISEATDIYKYIPIHWRTPLGVRTKEEYIPLFPKEDIATLNHLMLCNKLSQ